jgi:hypothetical protein
MTVCVLAAGIGLAQPGRARAAGTAAGMASNGSPTARATIIIARPAGTTSGAVMVAAVVINDDDPGFTAPAGWTLVRQDSILNALRQAIYLKVATASEPSSYTWTLSVSRRVAGGITTYTGVDPGHPVDVHGAQVHTTASTAVTAPSITTTVPDTLLVHIAAVAAEGTITPPTGMTEGWEAAAPRTNSTQDATVDSSYAPQAPAGATGPRTATATQAGRSIGALLALRSSGPPGVDTTPPQTTINSGPQGFATTSTATFAFSANEVGSTFECQLDGAAFAACTSPTSYAGLADGPHTFAVRATDTAVNTDPTSATRAWTIDTSGSPDPYTPIGNFPYSEGSGVVASRQYPGVVWTHRDSGDNGTRTVLYAFQVVQGAIQRFPSGELYKAFPVSGTTNVDWEDIGIDDGGNLYVGDVGRRAWKNRSTLKVLKIREPNPYVDAAATLIATYPFRYPSGNPDVESLFFHGGTVYLINKETPPLPHVLYRFDTLTPDVPTTLVKVRDVAEPAGDGFVDGEERISGADISPDGRRLIVVTGYRVYLYASTATLADDAQVAHLVSRPPVWSVNHWADGTKEQVEATAVLGDGSILTESEILGQIRYIDARLYEGLIP